MIYLEHIPRPPLDQFVQVLWHALVPTPKHQRERILPTGNTQVILNLARDFLLDCPEGEPARQAAASQVVGARTVYEIVDTSDMANLIGVVFRPGALPLFARDKADSFSHCNVNLEDVWGLRARGLRDRLRELDRPRQRLRCLEAFLATFCVARKSGSSVMPTIAFALGHFGQVPRVATVSEVARAAGWSERRFSQVFREQVGLSPKAWCRVQRFQRVVRQLHAGVDIPWPELALDCGYYDQSHFANEFRAFSGIDATTYTRLRGTPWANHVVED